MKKSYLFKNDRKSKKKSNKKSNKKSKKRDMKSIRSKRKSLKKNKNKHQVEKKKHDGNGKKINLSGPVSIIYYKNEALNKKIITLGDVHSGKENLCDPHEIFITDYLNNIISDKPIDIFVESWKPLQNFLIEDERYRDLFKPNKKFEEIEDFLKDVRRLALSEYKKNANKRFHFVDIRDQLSGWITLYNLEPFFKYVNNSVIKIDSSMYERVISELFQKLINVIFAFFEFLKGENVEAIEKYKEIFPIDSANFIPYSFQKELTKLENKNHILAGKIKKVLEQKLNKFLEFYFETFVDIEHVEHEHERDNEIIQKNNDLENRLKDITAQISDFYMIARIMKNDDITDCILYVGEAHQQFIKEYLLALNFDIVESQYNDYDADYKISRCLNNITDFNEFFSS